MKRFWMAIFLALILMCRVAVAQEKRDVPPPPKPTDDVPSAAKSAATVPALTTREQKFSYALGMTMGNNFRKQSVDVNPNLVAQGLKDAMASGKTRLTEDEAKAVLAEVQSDVRKQEQENTQQAGATNEQEGEAFLAANREKEGVATLPSGLQYKILRYGTGPKPSAGDSVVCNYRGTFINGKEFDSSYKRGQPPTVPVSGVIKGWTEALQLMSVGSKWQLFVPASLAYGERGAGTEIGPNTTLLFEVELLSIAGQPATTQCDALDQTVQIDDASGLASTGEFGHCAGEADFWFTNTSSRAIDCAIIFHKSGRFDPASVLNFTLSPGEKSGGPGKISACGSDTGQMTYRCFSHAENTASSCTAHIQW
jgi:FKBP-type peptidyl-prolyl cis-trans isomerase FklB